MRGDSLRWDARPIRSQCSVARASYEPLDFGAPGVGAAEPRRVVEQLALAACFERKRREALASDLTHETAAAVDVIADGGAPQVVQPLGEDRAIETQFDGQIAERRRLGHA